MRLAGPALALVMGVLLAGGCAPPAPAVRVAPGTPDPAFSAPDSRALADFAPLSRQAGSALRATERIGRRMTVRVRAVGCESLGTGSGFLLDETLLVTNRHVVEDAMVLELNTWDGQSVEAVLTAVAYADDLALVRIAESLPSVGRLATSDADPGERVTVVGYPHGGPLLETTGTLLEYAPLQGEDAASPVMRLSATIQPGNSGGPVLADDGSVVGVVFGVEPSTGNGLAIPASAVRELLQRGGAPPEPASCQTLGVTVDR